MNIDSLTKIIKNSKKKTKKSLLEIQQRFKSERHDVLTEEINKVAVSSNHYKRMQSTDSIETYLYGTGKVLVIEEVEIKCSNIKKRFKK